MDRLSWNEIRARAAKFAQEWKDACYEKRDAQSFYNDFFDVFGVPRRRVASFEEPVKKLGDRQGFIDLIWKGVLIVEQKSAGRDLSAAKGQALDYFPGLQDHELPRYVLASDFQNFDLYDLDEGTEWHFKLKDLRKNVQHFGFIRGLEPRQFKEQDPASVHASYLLGRLHDALEESGYKGHDLEVFLVRILFCLFADDTEIFQPKGIFEEFVQNRTRVDGTDTGPLLAKLFQVLDEPEEKREATLDEDLAKFDYIDGQLFQRPIRMPSFNSDMRQMLLDACGFDWSTISPAIFGALFQSVMEPEERRQQGAHYTTEVNIRKVIEPLFMDELRDQFETIRARKDKGRIKALQEFQVRLSELTFFDPACGCGNFLVIAYRELRFLELDVLRELQQAGQRVTDIDQLVRVNVNQFYGIEINEFPVRIAEVAMWMMDHIMNVQTSDEFGLVFRRIPLTHAPTIRHADALEIEWAEVIDPADCDFVYGNPPFAGSKVQSAAQRSQVQREANLGRNQGTLDYVCAWFVRAGRYLQGSTARIGFVATNSISQGEQVGQLWPVLFGRFNLEISFAHRTFAWGSDAKGKAHVHVIILGLVRRDQEPDWKRLYSYPDVNGDPILSEHSKLSPYLIDAGSLANPHLTINETASPINGAPPAIIGSKPVDGGGFILSEQEYAEFAEREPDALPFIHPLLGSDEFINGKKRYILALHDCPPQTLRRLPMTRARMERVQKWRLKSPSPPTRELANTPTRYHVNVIPDRPFLVLPQTSSETRDYMPIGFERPPVIPTNAVKVVLDAELYDFGILTSNMHMAWMKTITGRLESRYQYSIGVVYNCFPWPQVTDAQRARLIGLARSVLTARAQHQEACLADLYDPLTMPADLRRAHEELDKFVDGLYRPEKFENDHERVEHLFMLYEAMITPMAQQMRPESVAQPRRRRRTNSRR